MKLLLVWSVRWLIFAAIIWGALWALTSIASAQCRSYSHFNHYVATYKAPVVYHAPKQQHHDYYDDRYYALSSFYRDRMLLDMFDRLKAYDQQRSAAPPQADAAPPPLRAPPAASAAPAPAAPPARSLGKTSAKALAVLTANCLSCHGSGDPRIDLSNSDSVPLTKRRAALSLMMTADMPPPPSNLLTAGKEEDLAAWRKANAIPENDLQEVYRGWVVVPVQTARK